MGLRHVLLLKEAERPKKVTEKATKKKVAKKKAGKK